MKHKTKLLVLMLSAVMALVLPFAGCSKRESADTNTDSDADS